MSCLEGPTFAELRCSRLCIHISRFGMQMIRKMSMTSKQLNRTRQASEPRTIKYRIDRGSPATLESFSPKQGIFQAIQMTRFTSMAPSRILIRYIIGDQVMRIYQWLTLSGAQKIPRIAALKKSCTISVTGTRKTKRACMGFEQSVTARHSKSNGTSNARGRMPEPSVGMLNGPSPSLCQSRTKPPALRCMRQMLFETTRRYQASIFSPRNAFGSARQWEANDDAM
mmetsp:Transcript_45726/g.120844  ORF Transcript_45726/g.120844 Transcript_45726/m.120844 type:complete len:226 (+) Transcript_45726:2300-2977(+)